MRAVTTMICGMLGAALLSAPVMLPASAAMAESSQVSETDDSGISIDTSGDTSYDVFTYRENDTGVCITSCDTAATSADIPEEIDGKPVTEIGDAAFMNCAYLTAIDVPSHVTKIGESAFSSCLMLCQVSLPEGLTELGKGVFESCTMLSQVTLPSTLTELPEAAFYNCSYLPSFSVPATIKVIGNEAFYSCTALKEVTLPEGVASIGDYAFQNCQVLEQAKLPASCTTLGKYVFDGCQALTALDVAEGNTAYLSQDGVLFTKDGETLVRYPQAKAETAYTVPEGCRTLADWSFIGSTTLEQINIDGVTSIGEDCFYYCTSLKSIVIPDGVAELNGAVFGYCLSLEEVKLPATIWKLGDHCFYSCAKLNKIDLPEGLTTLGDQCFYNCVSLLEMNLPQTITEIGDQAIGYYTPSDSKDNTAKKIDRLHVYNAGSNAVSQYIRQWKSDDYKYWIISGAVAVVIVGGVIALISVRRYRNKIRPTSRHASETKRKKK